MSRSILRPYRTAGIGAAFALKPIKAQLAPLLRSDITASGKGLKMWRYSLSLVASFHPVRRYDLSTCGISPEAPFILLVIHPRPVNRVSYQH
ncbi:uncharacterized protein BDZ99DRAFT_299577 [Mytilinidion resinicola]|uniref:Uncharacterized protein n=1 Tax=Mytilinidion resinicola TaxID=574789 RepID=A0A6A6YPW0_9PEZI|nr:uncharacterized protein BDZ99DRAFT_299577 [Mytilinidion resinicola]KAF2809907.1 hypothetical protein BDZ99DRAFT_299577 [Mytilinidion resinicola]